MIALLKQNMFLLGTASQVSDLAHRALVVSEVNDHFVLCYIG